MNLAGISRVCGRFQLHLFGFHLNSGLWFLKAQQATSCDCRPVTWGRRPAVFTSEVTVDVGQRGQPGAEVTESGSHVRSAGLAAPILLYPPTHPTNPTTASYGTLARLQDQPGVVWSYPGEAQSPPQCHANRYQTPQQTHLDFKAIRDTEWAKKKKIKTANFINIVLKMLSSKRHVSVWKQYTCCKAGSQLYFFFFTSDSKVTECKLVA